MKPIQLPTNDGLPAKLRGRIKAANEQIGDILQSRSDLRLILIQEPDEDSTSVLLTERQEIASQYCDSYRAESLFFEHLDDLPQSIVEAARKLVKDAEGKANTALGKITNEIREFGLPFGNSNQEKFFISHCQRYLPHQTIVNDLLQYERQANQTSRAITQRLQWLSSEFHRLRLELLQPTSITA